VYIDFSHDIGLLLLFFIVRLGATACCCEQCRQHAPMAAALLRAMHNTVTQDANEGY
jgi:hypothetical protein